MVKKVELLVQWPDPGELMKSWWSRWETLPISWVEVTHMGKNCTCYLSFFSRIYDSPLSKFPRVSRFDVRSQQLEFSITDTQLPMFLRIVNLALALQNGDLERLKQVWPTMQFPSFFLAKKLGSRSVVKKSSQKSCWWPYTKCRPLMLEQDL